MFDDAQQQTNKKRLINFRSAVVCILKTSFKKKPQQKHLLSDVGFLTLNKVWVAGWVGKKDRKET